MTPTVTNIVNLYSLIGRNLKIHAETAAWSETIYKIKFENAIIGLERVGVALVLEGMDLVKESHHPVRVAGIIERIIDIETNDLLYEYGEWLIVQKILKHAG